MDNVRPEWASFLMRVISEADKTLKNNASDGIAIVTAHVAIDGSGTPLVWVVPDGKRIEPSRDAKATLMRVLSGN